MSDTKIETLAFDICRCQTSTCEMKDECLRHTVTVHGPRTPFGSNLCGNDVWKPAFIPNTPDYENYN